MSSRVMCEPPMPSSTGDTGAIWIHWRNDSSPGCDGWMPRKLRISCVRCRRSVELGVRFAIDWKRLRGCLKLDVVYRATKCLGMLLASLVEIFDGSFVNEGAHVAVPYLDGVRVVPLDGALDAVTAF